MDLSGDRRSEVGAFGAHNRAFDGGSGLESMVDYTPMGEDVTMEDTFVDEANNTVPYSKQRRGYGRGDLRLGKGFILSENIYTLAFLAALNNEEIDAILIEDGGKPPQIKNTLTTPKGTFAGFSENFDENDPSFLETEAAMLKWEEATMKRYETWKQERNRLMVHVFVCMASQVLLLLLLFHETEADFNLSATV